MAWVLDTVHAALLMKAVYIYLVTDIGKLQLLDVFQRYDPSMTLFDRISSLVCIAPYWILHSSLDWSTSLCNFCFCIGYGCVSAHVFSASCTSLTMHPVSHWNKILVACLFVFPLVQFAFAIVTFVEEYGKKTFEELRGTLITAQVGTGFVILAETALAGTMVILLRRMKSNLRRTNTLVERIMVYFISTGLITSEGFL